MPDLREQIRQLIDQSTPTVTMDEIAQLGYATRRPKSATARFVFAIRLKTCGPGIGRHMRLTLVVALVLAVVGVAVSVTTSTGGEHRRAATAPTPPASSWTLAADLSGSQFQLATGNPEAVVGVNCSGGATCFLSTGYGSGGNASHAGSTYVSHDAGMSWQPTTLPDGISTTTLVSCASTSWCAAGSGLLDTSTGDPLGGKPSRDPELLVTTDGGATWTTHAVPIPPHIEQIPASDGFPAETTSWPGTVDDVTCTGPGICDVVAHVQDDVPSSLIPDELIFLRTIDGGDHWTSTVLPERSSETQTEVQRLNTSNGAAMACPTVNNCVVIATLAGFDPYGGAVDVWRTTDRGQTWQESQVPGVDAVFARISCPDAQNCWAGPSIDVKPYPSGTILHSSDGGATWTLLPAPAIQTTSPAQAASGPIWQAISCTSAEVCYLAGPGITVTTDGGNTWNQVSLPSQAGTVPSIACVPHGGCVAVAGGNPLLAGEGSLILTTNPSTSADPGPSATSQP